MSSMVRHIIRQYFNEKQERVKFEEFKRLQKSQSGGIPHVPGPDQPEAARKLA